VFIRVVSLIPFDIFRTEEAKTMAADVKMNFLTLRFDGALESAFIKDYFDKYLNQVRFALLAGIFLYSGFGMVDALILPAEKPTIWAIRYAVACPLVWVIFGFTFCRSFRKFMQASVSLAILIAGFSIIAMSAVIRDSYFDQIHVSLILLLMASYTLIKLRFIYATVTGWALVGAYDIVAFSVRHLSFTKLALANIDLICANLIGMFSCYLIELYIRRNFFHTKLLEAEREKSERLLLNILPSAIAERLKQNSSTLADYFPEVTVLFADLVDFTEIASRITPTELVTLLNEIFSAFDRLAEWHGLEKIKTIGDAYMLVGGLPVPRPEHAEAVAEMALDMLEEISRFRTKEGEPLSLRIGINTGPAVAGVIGLRKFSYDLWGDTVNTASRMESQGKAGSIQVTAATYQILRHKYLFKERGEIDVKGKGKMRAYLLTGRKADNLERRTDESRINATHRIA
jgi:class 3 adenylate cyclase